MERKLLLERKNTYLEIQLHLVLITKILFGTSMFGMKLG